MRRLLLLVSILLISNCSRMILNAKGSHVREIKVFEKDDQKILYLGMTHLAKPQFFSEVKEQIDSLRAEGYVFFKEGVTYHPNTSPKQKDTLQRKFRQLIGLTIGDYTDPANKSLPRFFSNGKYIMQTDSLIGLNEADQRVDLTYNEMIEAHENKYSEINLTNCDFDTGIYEKYKCKDGNAYKDSFYVVDILRTELLTEAILSSKEKKIAVVYGAGHFKWLYAALTDASYEYKNKKLSFR